MNFNLVAQNSVKSPDEDLAFRIPWSLRNICDMADIITDVPPPRELFINCPPNDTAEYKKILKNLNGGEEDTGEYKKILKNLYNHLRNPKQDDEGWWCTYIGHVLDMHGNAMKLSFSIMEEVSEKHLEIMDGIERLVELFPKHIPAQILIDSISRYLASKGNGTKPCMKILLNLFKTSPDLHWIVRNKDSLIGLFVYGLD